MARVALKVVIVLAVLAAAVYVLFFTGRTGSGNALTISFWGSYQEWEMWDEIVRAFLRKHPEEEVEMEYWADGGTYTDKARIRFNAGNPPDVMLYQDEPMPPAVAEDRFEDLTPYLKTPGCELDLDRDYWQTSVDSFEWEGRQYGIPIWGGDNLIYINLDLFDRLGVPYPKDDWTLEEFHATCRRLTRDLDGDGRLDTYGFAPTYWLYYLPFLYAHGARFLEAEEAFPTTADKAKWALVGDEAVAAIRFLQDLMWKDHVMPHGGETAETETAILFLTGRIAMYTSGPWEMPVLRETNLRWDVAHIPSGPGGRGTRITWDCLAIPKGAKHKKRAWRLIHFAVSREAQEIVARKQRSVPALKAARDVFVKTNPDVHAVRFIEAMAYARMQPMTELWDKMSQEIGPVFEGLFDVAEKNRLTPEDAVRRLAEREHALFSPPEDRP